MKRCVAVLNLDRLIASMPILTINENPLDVISRYTDVGRGLLTVVLKASIQMLRLAAQQMPRQNRSQWEASRRRGDDMNPHESRAPYRKGQFK